MEESYVLKGIMVNKDIVHPKMRRRIENPRILLLDCNLEYKKGESQTSLEFTKEKDFAYEWFFEMKIILISLNIKPCFGIRRRVY